MVNKLKVIIQCAVVTCLAIGSTFSSASGVLSPDASSSSSSSSSGTISASSSSMASSAAKKVRLDIITGELRNSSGNNLPLPKEFMQAFSNLEKDLKIKIILHQYPWNRAVMMARYEGDLIFGLSSTPEREKMFAFSEPVFYNNLWLVTRSDKAFDFRSIQDLKGKTIGVVRGSQYGGEFDAQKNKIFKTDDDLDSHEIRLKKLLENRIDAMIYASLLDNPAEVEKIINAMNISRKGINAASNIQFSVLTIPILKSDLRFAIRKDKNNGWIEKINASLNKANQDKINQEKAKQKSVLLKK